MLAWVAWATASASRLKRVSDLGLAWRHVGPEDLEGDLALQRHLFGEVDLAHAALAELRRMWKSANVRPQRSGVPSLDGPAWGWVLVVMVAPCVDALRPAAGIPAWERPRLPPPLYLKPRDARTLRDRRGEAHRSRPMGLGATLTDCDHPYSVSRVET